MVKHALRVLLAAAVVLGLYTGYLFATGNFHTVIAGQLYRSGQPTAERIANDGIISTASLIIGVASAAAAKPDVLLAGTAGLVAGAMSMAAGEYVSVSSQSDTEQADLEREKQELAEDPAFEREELAQIYVARGVETGLAREVARQLMAKDALEAHARDELGISEITTARPVQGAFTSAATFSLGAAAPLILVAVAPQAAIVPLVAAGSLAALALLGLLGAKTGVLRS